MDCEKECKDFGYWRPDSESGKRCGNCPVTKKCLKKFLEQTRKMSPLLKTLAIFYKLPYENVLVNTTHQEFIELTIEDMAALASIPKLDLDWVFTQIVLLEEDKS
jgi:hypothetical protein